MDGIMSSAQFSLELDKGNRIGTWKMGRRIFVDQYLEQSG